MGCLNSKVKVGNNQDAMNLVNPFEIFPEELWEIILGKLDNSDDLLNSLAAFPQLRCLSKGKQCSWLFGEVFPLILPKYLALEDVRSCRLVSKLWNSAVGSSLETHPDRLPYKSPKLRRITNQHFNYKTAMNITTNFAQFTQNCGDVDALEISHNPFPGRHILLVQSSFHSINTLLRGLLLLEKIGNHIWYLDIVFPTETTQKSKSNGKVALQLLQYLVHLRNLRSLTIKGALPGQLNASDVYTLVPPSLKSLDMGYCVTFGVSSYMYTSLVNHFSDASFLTKLVIDLNFWKGTLGKGGFPMLTDLELIAARNCNAWDLPIKRRIKTVLREIQAPQLRKLHIYTNSVINVYDTLRILVPYKLESLVLRGNFYEIKPRQRFQYSLATVTECTLIRLMTLEYEFVKWLPSLERLTIVPHYGNADKQREVRNKLGSNRKTIWKRLPKLKMLNEYQHGPNGRLVQYVREDKLSKFVSGNQLYDNRSVTEVVN